MMIHVSYMEKHTYIFLKRNLKCQIYLKLYRSTRITITRSSRGINPRVNRESAFCYPIRIPWRGSVYSRGIPSPISRYVPSAV